MKFSNKFSLITGEQSLLKIIGLGFLMLLTALFSSAVIIVGGPKYTLMLVGGVVGLLFLVMPPQWLLSMLIVFVYLIYGPLNYFASIDTTWVPYLIGLGLLFMAFLGRMGTKNAVNEGNYQSGKISSYIWCLLIFLIIAIFSTASGLPNRYTLLISIRGLFLAWGVYFILSLSSFKPQYFRNVWLFLMTAGILQLPMALYQRLVVVPTRTDFALWDSVIGTFPGNKILGDSGGMAFFLLSVSTIAVSLWRYSQLSGQRTLLLICLFLAPILLAEVKVSYLLIPVMTILIFRSEFKHKPIKFISGLIMACLFVVSIFFAGKYLNTPADGSHEIDMAKDFKAIFSYSTSIDAYAGVEMGRFKLLDFWWENNKENPLRLILGHGLGSTSLGESFYLSGSEAWKYRPANIAHTAAASLLWETGILGLLAYIAIHIFGAIHAGQLAKVAIIPPFHQAMLNSANVIILSKILLIPYQLGSATTQVFFLLLLGMVAFWDKQISFSRNK
jgi:hypothetical protein